MPRKSSPSSETPLLGEPIPAPEISGLVRDSLRYDAKSLAGRWIVLYFYPKDMTSGCTLEGRDFESLGSEFGAQEASVLGVSKDSCASHAKFAAKEGLTFLLLSDPDGELCERYGVWKEKSMYGRKYMGIERSTFLIDPKGQLVAEWRNVKVPGHAAAVLETLRRLRNP